MVVFRDRRAAVSWLGGAYTQQYTLASDMTTELEHRETLTPELWNVCVSGFEQLCMCLREDF